MSTVFHVQRQIGIVIERRLLANAWATHTWQPLAIVPEPGTPGGRCLRDDGQRSHYLLSPATLELHRSDAASYRYNLAGEQPALFVALRRDETLTPVPWRVLLVTAAPDEAQKLMDAGDDLIEAVPMPGSLMAWIADFVATCPPDEPFEKRQRVHWRDTEKRR